MNLSDRFAGCLLGLALGDATGAPREGGVPERAAWLLLGRTLDGRQRWTDDTQMTLARTESLIARHGLDLDDAARRMTQAYQWRRGYGPGAAKVLARIRRGMPWQQASRSVYPDGSYGNGGAMRVTPLALWFAPDGPAAWQAARASAAITHAHAEAQWGADAVALAVCTALRCSPNDSPVDFWNAWRLSLQADIDQAGSPAYQDELRWADQQLNAANAVAASPRDVQKHLGCGVAARRSVVTAIYLAARYMGQPMDALLRFCLRRTCGGWSRPNGSRRRRARWQTRPLRAAEAVRCTRVRPAVQAPRSAPVTEYESNQALAPGRYAQAATLIIASPSWIQAAARWPYTYRTHHTRTARPARAEGAPGTAHHQKL